MSDFAFLERIREGQAASPWDTRENSAPPVEGGGITRQTDTPCFLHARLHFLARGLLVVFKSVFFFRAEERRSESQNENQRSHPLAFNGLSPPSRPRTAATTAPSRQRAGPPRTEAPPARSMLGVVVQGACRLLPSVRIPTWNTVMRHGSRVSTFALGARRDGRPRLLPGAVHRTGHTELCSAPCSRPFPSQQNCILSGG